MAVARVLRQTFSDSTLTQKQLERRSGVSQAKISMGLRGLEPFSLDQLAAICEALNVDVAEVIIRATRR